MWIKCVLLQRKYKALQVSVTMLQSCWHLSLLWWLAGTQRQGRNQGDRSHSRNKGRIFCIFFAVIPVTSKMSKGLLVLSGLLAFSMSLELTLLQLNSTNQDKGIVNILHHQKKKIFLENLIFVTMSPYSERSIHVVLRKPCSPNTGPSVHGIREPNFRLGAESPFCSVKEIRYRCLPSLCHTMINMFSNTIFRCQLAGPARKQTLLHQDVPAQWTLEDSNRNCPLPNKFPWQLNNSPGREVERTGLCSPVLSPLDRNA